MTTRTNKIILHVDDNAEIRFITAHMLRPAGFEIWEAATGTEALRKATLEPDLIILDIHLPDLNGLEVCRRLRSDPATRSIPVLHLSAAFVNPSDRAAGLECGADAYLTQPVDPAELIATVRTLLRLKSVEKALTKQVAQLEASRAEASLLAHLVEQSSQPVGVGYPDGRLGMTNAAFCDLVGYTKDELAAMDWERDLTPPEWQAIERANLEELNRANQPVRYEKEYICRDGTRRPVELFVHVVRDDGGTPLYYYAFVTDITERKRAEQQLRQQAEELRARNEELARFNRAMVAREERMIELKRQINDLHRRLGEPPPFPLQFDESADGAPAAEPFSAG